MGEVSECHLGWVQPPARTGLGTGHAAVDRRRWRSPIDGTSRKNMSSQSSDPSARRPPVPRADPGPARSCQPDHPGTVTHAAAAHRRPVRMAPQPTYRPASRHSTQTHTAATDVHIDSDEAGVVEHYALKARDNCNFARFNKLSLDHNGSPQPERPPPSRGRRRPGLPDRTPRVSRPRSCRTDPCARGWAVFIEQLSSRLRCLREPIWRNRISAPR
jgi:hypothetical protein